VAALPPELRRPIRPVRPGRADPITLAPVTQPKFQPVVGSVARTHHFANPLTGRAKYAGDALDPTTAGCSGTSFKQ